MVVEWWWWWCSCGVMLMVRGDGDDQEKKKNKIFRVFDYDMMKIVQGWWWWCRDEGADMVMMMMMMIMRYYDTVVLMIICHLTIRSSWEGHTAIVLGQYDMYTTYIPTTQQINLFTINNIMVMLDIGDDYDDVMAILILWYYAQCLLWWYRIRWQHYGNAWWWWWWYCSDADGDNYYSCIIWWWWWQIVMVMITVNIDADKDACSHTVPTGAGLAISSNEVNSSHASMALDNSLSTCFMSKDVSQYEHVVGLVLLMLSECFLLMNPAYGTGWSRKIHDDTFV